MLKRNVMAKKESDFTVKKLEKKMSTIPTQGESGTNFQQPVQ